MENEWKLIATTSNGICWLVVDGWTTRWKTSTCTWWLVRVFGGSCQTLGLPFRSLRNKRGDVATFVARQILAFRSKFAGPSVQWRVRQEKTRQGKTRQDQTRQDQTRQDKTRQSGACATNAEMSQRLLRDRFLPSGENSPGHRPSGVLDKTRQDKTRQDKTRQDKKRQDKTRQDVVSVRL